MAVEALAARVTVWELVNPDMVVARGPVDAPAPSTVIGFPTSAAVNVALPDDGTVNTLLPAVMVPFGPSKFVAGANANVVPSAPKCLILTRSAAMLAADMGFELPVAVTVPVERLVPGAIALLVSGICCAPAAIESEQNNAARTILNISKCPVIDVNLPYSECKVDRLAL